IQTLDLGVLHQIDDFHRRADPETAVWSRDRRRVERAFDIDEAVGRRNVILHAGEQVLPAGERHGDAAGQLERRHRFFFVPRVDVCESLHSVPPAFCCSIASSTFCGVSGRLRIVAPVAFRTALAIADAVETVGGSPMPMTPRSGWFFRWTSIFGTSDMPASRYHSMFGLTICPVTRSGMRSSNSAKFSEPMMPP